MKRKEDKMPRKLLNKFWLTATTVLKILTPMLDPELAVQNAVLESYLL
jgi:hypothetical protein